MVVVTGLGADIVCVFMCAEKFGGAFNCLEIGAMLNCGGAVVHAASMSASSFSAHRI
jgi:hypothetical protein